MGDFHWTEVSALSFLRLGDRKDIWLVKKPVPLIRKRSVAKQVEEESSARVGYTGKTVVNMEVLVMVSKTGGQFSAYRPFSVVCGVFSCASSWLLMACMNHECFVVQSQSLQTYHKNTRTVTTGTDSGETV